MKPLCAFLALTFLFSSGARAGAYQYSSQAGDPDLGFDQPARINQMYGYSGVATALTIAVCILFPLPGRDRFAPRRSTSTTLITCAGWRGPRPGVVALRAIETAP